MVYLSVTTAMEMIFWTEAVFCFRTDCRNSINNELKKQYIYIYIYIFQQTNTHYKTKCFCDFTNYSH